MKSLYFLIQIRDPSQTRNRNSLVLFGGCSRKASNFGHFSLIASIADRQYRKRSFPGSRLGTQGFRGSASRIVDTESRFVDRSAGRACNSVRSQAEPGNEILAISEKCQKSSNIITDRHR